jgi:hypothetical protein
MTTTLLGQEPAPGNALHVILLREMWGDFFTLVLDSGHTEELEPEETRTWFKVRGADMDKMEKVLDQCWNFGRAEAIIDNSKEPPVTRLPYSPNI